MFVQCKQTGHVSRKNVVRDLSKPARVSVSSNNVEDLRAGLCMAADAHGVLVRVEHRCVIIQVFYLNVHICLSTEASLKESENSFY